MLAPGQRLGGKLPLQWGDIVELMARGDGTVALDFTGSDPQVRAALNLPTGSMPHHPFLARALVNFIVTRSEAIVAADVAAGLVSPARARAVYGVVIGDTAATAALRQRLREAGAAAEAFDFGAARRDWERRHGRAAEQIAAFLPNLPAGLRRYAQGEIHRHLHRDGPGPYGKAAIVAAIAAVGDALGPPAPGLRAAAE